jgi:hypothetical protein
LAPSDGLEQRAWTTAESYAVLFTPPLMIVAHWTFCVIDPPHAEAFAWPYLGIFAFVPLVLALLFAFYGADPTPRATTPLWRRVVHVPAAALLLFGAWGFYAKASTGAGVSPWTGRASEFPLHAIGGVVIDKSGRVYVGLEETNRIQVYSPQGRFLFGWLAFSDGDFTLKIDNDRLLLHDQGGPRLDTFDLDGNRTDTRQLAPGEVPIAPGSDQTALAPDGATLSIADGIVADRIVRQVPGGDWVVLIDQPRPWWRIDRLPPLIPGAAGFGLLMLLGFTRPSTDTRPRENASSSPPDDPLLVAVEQDDREQHAEQR